MKKKETKITHAAHIKRHTEGTSNEISFSVLDAAKSRLDEDGKAGKVEFPRPGGLSVLTWRMGRKKPATTPTKENALPLSSGEVVSGGEAVDSSTPGTLSGNPPAEGSGATSDSTASTKADKKRADEAFGSIPLTSSQVDEIERRKSRRRVRRVIMTIIGIVITLALVGGGSYLLYNEITHHQEQVSLVDQALQKVSETDATVVALDRIINGSFADSSAQDIEDVISDIPPTAALLDEAEKLATDAESSMRDSSDKEAADQVLNAVTARRDMLSHAQVILEVDVQAKDDIDILRDTWNAVLDGDSAAREASALVTDTTPENVTASMEKTSEASDSFTRALEYIEELETSSLDLELASLEEYVSKRLESMTYAIASDEAILAQDRPTAEAQNEAYNVADAEASALAGNIPDDITELVSKARASETKDARDQYSQARFRASTADAFLRDYLGT